MAVATTTNEQRTGDRPEPSRWAGWMARVDGWCERIGDSINPILVKETRQALKSRQFVITFYVLLVAALGWTVIGSLSLMPQIYTSPSAPRMLVGYYVVLAVPMLLVVPLAAYRSLEGEIDDGTLELLSITALGPWQIVLGKLLSAMLQMLLYFIVLFPCFAYAYTLRGVDLPTTLLMLGALAVAGLVMTIYALFFAPLSRSRTGRVGTLLVVLLSLLVAEYGVGGLVIGLIQSGNPLPRGWTGYLIAFTLLHALTIGHLLLTATAAQLTPESENRSSRLRLAMLLVTAVSVGLVAFAIPAFEEESEPVFALVLLFLAFLWTLAGSMFAAESPAMTPRIRRELPSSFAARMLLTFLTPGPATGLVFAAVGVLGVATAAYLGVEEFRSAGNLTRYRASFLEAVVSWSVLYSCYLVAFLVGVRWLVALVRVRNNPRVEIGLAALIAIAVVASLVPYSVGLHLNDYSPYEYSAWQVTNWVWTLGEAGDANVSTAQHWAMVLFVALLLLGNVVTLGRIVLPRRVALPQRVRLEREGKRSAASKPGDGFTPVS